MNSTYAQKSSTVQKAADTKAASVLDSSAQSESLQRKADMTNNAAQRAEAPRPNNTGMPDNLKAGIESLSGFSMDDVRVHYNSSKPATVQALAYTQGTDIHVAPGQEKCLPHEAWHVAQQMAGRVSPTTNINGMPVNDNAALEHEADVMGEKAVQCKSFVGGEGRVCVNEKSTQLRKCVQRVGSSVWIQKSGEGIDDVSGILDEIKKILIEKCELYLKTLKDERRESRKKNSGDSDSYVKDQIKYALDVNTFMQKLNEELGKMQTGSRKDKGKAKQQKLTCKNISIESIESSKSYRVVHKAKGAEEKTKLFNILFDDDRFEEASMSERDVVGSKKVYRRKGDASEKRYVVTANGCYVPRYVYRYLNRYDKKNFSFSGAVGPKVEKSTDPFCDVDHRNPLSLKPQQVFDNCLFYIDKFNDDSPYDMSSLAKRNGILNCFYLKDDVDVFLSDEKSSTGKVRWHNVDALKRYFLWLYINQDEANIDQIVENREKVFKLYAQDKKNVKKTVLDKVNERCVDAGKKDLYSFLKLSDAAKGGTNGCEYFWQAYMNRLKNGNFDKEILEHQRQKERQGGSCFVSCTATRHPIFGSSGNDFYQSSSEFNAVAKIDLTKVKSPIYSTYSQKVFVDLYKRGVPKYDGDDFDRALIDSIRTREIVICGPIPKEAIEEICYSKQDDDAFFQEYEDGKKESKRSVWTKSPR